MKLQQSLMSMYVALNFKTFNYDYVCHLILLFQTHNVLNFENFLILSFLINVYLTLDDKGSSFVL